MLSEPLYTCIAASKEGHPNIYIRCNQDFIVRVIDMIHDRGWKVWQCAEWKWNAQLIDGHEEKDGIAFELEDLNDVILFTFEGYQTT